VREWGSMEGVSVVKDWTDEESVVWLQQESNSMGLQNNKTTITHSHALTRAAPAVH
jgi:hypothetical protein